MPGVHSTAVGYINGSTPNPTYREVCGGDTGHAEAVQVVFDPAVTRFVDLLKPFWESHDPTQGMGQGGDRGTQYRSGVYVTSDRQLAEAVASRDAYQRALAKAGRHETITTEITKAQEFFYAEDYHQQYLDKPGNRKYCGAQPTSVSLPAVDSWGLPSVAPKASASDRVWSNTYDACIL
jgi:peptide-methionine (S)-S-oxide reductase